MLDVLDCRVVLITGERQVGKSTALYKAVTGLRDASLRVSGLLTSRTGPHDLQVTELHTGAGYALTDPFTDTHTAPTRNFAMNAEAMRRSSEAMTTGFPTDVFILDELGPLELVHHQGWVDVFRLLHQKTYQLAYLVVRPDLLGAAIKELPGISFVVIRVTDANRAAIPARLVRLALSAKTSYREESVDATISSFNEGAC
jgi:nucleoside-triphosphatase THEP1